jgi:hypothetical protein
MRTTLTIDDDTVRRLKERAHRTGRSFIERGAPVYSTDADFGRFAGVEHVNPLG